MSVRIAEVGLRSVSPYSQSKYYKVPKLPGESLDDFEERTWRERFHVNSDGFIFIPPMQFKNALSRASEYHTIKIPGKGNQTFTKHIKAGIMVTEGIILPNRKEDLKFEWLMVPADCKRGGTSRVPRCFGIIPNWSGTVEYIVTDDDITEEILKQYISDSGQFIGIGRFRTINEGMYGKFEIISFQMHTM